MPDNSSTDTVLLPDSSSVSGQPKRPPFLISLELFGFGNAYYFLLAIAISYMLSGYYSLYHSQTIVYSKFENRYVNKKAE